MRSLLLFGVVALAGGCYSVAARKAPGVNVSQYRTFDFYAPSDTRQTSLDQSPAGQAVRQRVQQELEARGLRQSPQPDFYVAYHLKTRERFDYAGWGYGYGGWGGWDGWYGGYYGGPAGYEYTEGTLIIDFIDPRTNQVFWRGTATREVSHPDNPDPNRVAKAVGKIMKRYPLDYASAPLPARM